MSVLVLGGPTHDAEGNLRKWTCECQGFNVVIPSKKDAIQRQAFKLRANDCSRLWTTARGCNNLVYNFVCLFILHTFCMFLIVI